MHKWSVLLWSLLLCVPAGLTGEPANQHAGVVVRAGRVLDVRSGAYRDHQMILIEGDRIREVGDERELLPHVPSDARVVDLSRYTVLPGLIDAHTHLTGSPYLMGYRGLAVSVPREALLGARNARVTLEAGFTTVRNVGASGFADIALRDAINAGDVPGPRILASGPPLGITGGHCDENLLAPEFHFFSEGVANGVPAVMAKVREDIKYGADLIKFCATGGVLSKGDNAEFEQYSPEEMQAIVREAHRLGRKVAAHAHGARGIKDAVLAGVDSIEHGSYITDEGIAAMKKHGTYLVPTLYLEDWMVQNGNLPPYSHQKMVAISAVAKQNIKRAMEAGVKIAMGTDAAVYPHGLNAHELDVYVNQLGMAPLAALQSATMNAADLMGWTAKTGSLDPGKWADIIAVEKNPLDDVRVLQNVKFVMKAGVVYKSEAKQ